MASGKNVSWRNGTKGRLKARLSAVRVRIADGPPSGSRIRASSISRRAAWLIGEHRTSGEKKYYLATCLPRQICAHWPPTIKARWICEKQAHQQLKEELGLDHFEGRSMARSSSSRADDHDRPTLSCNTVASRKRGGKKESTDLRLNQACRPYANAIVDLIFRPPSQRCPYCSNLPKVVLDILFSIHRFPKEVEPTMAA